MKIFKNKIIALLLLVALVMPILATPIQTYAASSSKSTKIESFAKKQLGKRYVWATQGPSTFDCSGFTYYVVKKTTRKTIPRGSTVQGKHGKYVSRKNLKKGDLVFFATTGKVIYLGNKKFIHASSSKGKVVISSMASGHYYKTFVNGRRVI